MAPSGRARLEGATCRDVLSKFRKLAKKKEELRQQENKGSTCSHACNRALNLGTKQAKAALLQLEADVLRALKSFSVQSNSTMARSFIFQSLLSRAS